MQCALLLSVIAVAVAAVRGDDECMPPKHGEKHTHHSDCCKVEKFFPEEFKANAKKCFEKFPPPPKPTGPPPAGASGPPPEVLKQFKCMGECMFAENNLLTADKQLDKDAVMKTFVTDDADLSPVLKSAVDKCLSSYMDEVDQSMECKSGAEEFKMCVSRSVFLSCPESLWTDSAECAELKTKTTKCKHMPVMMGMKPPHHHHH